MRPAHGIQRLTAPLLLAQEARAAFDIHDYGDRLVSRFSRTGEWHSFASLVAGQPAFEVCRCMLASLQLVRMPAKWEGPGGRGAGRRGSGPGCGPTGQDQSQGVNPQGSRRSLLTVRAVSQWNRLPHEGESCPARMVEDHLLEVPQGSVSALWQLAGWLAEGFQELKVHTP